MSKLCVVFVCNKKYFNKFVKTCSQLIVNGKYRGDICLVIGNDLKNNPLIKTSFITDNKIIVKHFPDITFTKDFLHIQQHLKRPAHWFVKIFQYHKFYLFDTYFKQWDYIFYLDCGLTIVSDISPMIAEASENTLFAHSDAYPNYTWKLHNQFATRETKRPDKEQKLVQNLYNTYKLDIDYFQTTIMLYDTKIIKKDTYSDLYNLALKYPISITNDQGIFSLYFTNIKPLWKQIKIYCLIEKFGYLIPTF